MGVGKIQHLLFELKQLGAMRIPHSLNAGATRRQVHRLWPVALTSLRCLTLEGPILITHLKTTTGCSADKVEDGTPAPT
jgi:hypothetical protein